MAVYLYTYRYKDINSLYIDSHTYIHTETKVFIYFNYSKFKNLVTGVYSLQDTWSVGLLI